MLATSVLSSLFLAVLIALFYTYRQVSYRKWLQTDEGMLQTALEHLQKEPRDIDCLRISAHIFYKKQNYRKALENFSRILLHSREGMPDYITTVEEFHIHLELGISAYKLKQYEKAIRNLKKARRLVPQSASWPLAFILGKLLYRRNYLHEAENELNRAYKIDPANTDTRFYLGMCHLKLENYPQSLSLLEPLEEQFRHSPSFRLALASCYDKNEDDDCAIELYKQLVKHDKIGAQAASQLAHLYLRQKELAQALQYFTQTTALEAPPGELSYDALYESAQIYVQLQDLHKACVPLQKLCDLAPTYRNTPTLLYHYRQMAENHNLYMLYYSDCNRRKQLVRDLALRLIDAGACHFEYEHFGLETIEIALSSFSQQNERNYFVWLNLSSELIGMQELREVLQRGKEFSSHYHILITPYVFDRRVKDFCQARPINLVEGEALHQQLLQLGP